MATTEQQAIEPLNLPVLHVVSETHAARKLAWVLGGLLLILPVLLSLVPWQQNVPGNGRVTALDPLDRIQKIPAPVTGRLVRLAVQEGSRVKEGDLLAEMEDQDPGFTARLQQQYQFATDKVEAAHDNLEFYNSLLEQLTDSREFALESARFELQAAIEKVREAEQDLEAFEAELDQKFNDRERKFKLLESGIVSTLDYEKAQRDYVSARAKVEGAKAKVEQARNGEKSKMATIEKVGTEQQAKIESEKGKREDAKQKLAVAEKERTEASTKLARQETQVVLAPSDGSVLRILGAGNSDLIARNDPLIEFVPDTDGLAVELWVRGIDAPLVRAGRHARIQFEGWPAVQFAGWPSVAVGTFGGNVTLVDAQADADGRSRVLIVPDPEEEPWPDQRYLRQGVRASGWIQLDTVSSGYEIWRQLNAFPPSVQAPDRDSSGDKGDKKKMDDEDKKS